MTDMKNSTFMKNINSIQLNDYNIEESHVKITENPNFFFYAWGIDSMEITNSKFSNITSEAYL